MLNYPKHMDVAQFCAANNKNEHCVLLWSHMLLEQGLLRDIHCLSQDNFVFQQDRRSTGTPAALPVHCHDGRSTGTPVALPVHCHVPQFIELQNCLQLSASKSCELFSVDSIATDGVSSQNCRLWLAEMSADHWLSVCLSVCLSAYVPVCVSVCLPVSLCVSSVWSSVESWLCHISTHLDGGTQQPLSAWLPG